MTDDAKPAAPAPDEPKPDEPKPPAAPPPEPTVAAPQHDHDDWPLAVPDAGVVLLPALPPPPLPSRLSAPPRRSVQPKISLPKPTEKTSTVTPK